MTIIQECDNKDCKHEFQDETYGHRRRVMNLKKQNAGGGEYVCTVCNKSKSMAVGKKK